MLLFVAFVMFALLIASWLMLPDKVAAPAKVTKTETAIDTGMMPVSV